VKILIALEQVDGPGVDCDEEQEQLGPQHEVPHPDVQMYSAIIYTSN
jgi:hypothetical protein